MIATQLTLARWPGTPTVHPDGTAAVVAVTRIDLDADDYTSQLWRLDGANGGQRQLTYGWRDSAPAYSPDGAWIAFVRVERDRAGQVGKPQLWVLPTTGGEPRRLTDAPSGVSAPAWSPDSVRLVFLARTPAEGRDAAVEPGKQPPRRITRRSYRQDGLGFLDSPRQIWVVSLNPLAGSVTPEQITHGETDHETVSWHPHGDRLVFTASGHDERRDDLRRDVWICRPDGSDRRAVTRGGMWCDSARFTPDGSAIVFAGATITDGRRDVIARNVSLWSVPADGSAAPVRRTDAERHNLGAPFEVTDSGVLFPNEHRGAIELLLVPYGDGDPEILMTGPRQIGGVGAAAGRIVATVADERTWGEVVVREPDGAERVLSCFNAVYGADVPIHGMAEVTATAPDGYPVHGWLVRPAGAGPHPVVLLIHGGPFAQYGWALFDEAQVYATAGYAVLMANPRGSSGYGQQHGSAIRGDVGARSAADLMAILEHVLASDASLDPARVVVHGGSHGGFMTTWLAAHEGHRFRAAISERAVNAIDSFSGSSDIGWFFADDLYGPDVAAQRRQSPLTYANDIRIPMLIIHSEQDWRCPIEQAQRLYAALRRTGTPVEMLIFPGEGHELSRTGLPSHRIARFDAILEWFGRYV
jgi:dipeptidyl aminopeptidase/acylaminoacyl peptidase